MAQRRQLAAIMFTDMIGYTALMGRDEILAKKLRDRHREVLKARHEEHFGEIIQYFGDGTLSIFNSSVEAVKCAIAIQRDLREDPIVPLRIGLHSGELVYGEEDVFGSAVNIASRMESFAVEGAILTSSKVQGETSNHPDILFQSVGTFQLKNVPKPMEIFAVANEGIFVPEPSELEGKGKRIETSKSEAAPVAPPPPLPPLTSESGVVVNDILIDVICEDLAAYSKDLDDELNKEDLDIPSIKREIIDVFPTPIGEQLRILFTRSNDPRRADEMETFSLARLTQLAATHWTSLQFISFIMLSQLWDEKYKNKDLEFTEEQLNVLKNFSSLDGSNYREFNFAQLINTLEEIFDEGKVPYFIDELQSFKIDAAHDKELHESHEFMRALNSKLLKEEIEEDQLEDQCLEAEEHLGVLLSKIAFLVKYKLVTIKNIELVKGRHESVRYRHKQITLNRALTVASTGVAEVGVEFENFADNKSVLFLKVDKNEINSYLNLTPFIIDENALNSDLSSKIFLFIYYENDAYHYQFMNNPADKPLAVNKRKYPRIKVQFDRFWTEILGKEFQSGGQEGRRKGGSRFIRKR